MKQLKTIISYALILVMLAGFAPPISAAGLFEPLEVIMPADKMQISFESEDETSVLTGTKMYRYEREDVSGGWVLKGRRWEETVPGVDRVGDLRLTLDLPEENIYCIWARFSSVNDKQASFFIRENKAAYNTLWIATDGPDYAWKMILIRSLKKGKNTIDIVLRDSGAEFDRFLISRSVGFNPSGFDGFEEAESVEVAEKYNAPPVLPPANEHPRLMFREKDIPAIKHAYETREDNKIVYEKLVKTANSKGDGKLDPNGNPKDNGQKTFLNIASACAFMYALDPENNYDYARRAYEIYCNYADSWIIEATGTTLIRPVGDMIRLGSEIYDWCYDALTAEERETLYKYAMSYMTKMSVGWPPVNQDNFTSHAMESQLPIDIMSFAVAVYDEHPDVWDVVAGRIYQEVIHTQSFLYRGGSMSEGTDYTLERICNIYYCMWMLKRMGYVRQFDDYSMDKVLITWLYKTRPDGGLLSNGDCWNVGPGMYSMDFCVFLHYTYYKNPYTKYLYMMTGNGSGVYTEGANNHEVSPALFLILNIEDIEEKTWYDLPLAYHFGGDGTGTEAGLMIRSDWRKAGANGDYGYNIQLRFAPHQLGSHQHLDSGAFQISYGGVGLALDTGIYNAKSYINNDGVKVTSSLGWGGIIHHGYTVLTVAHNCMLIRGDDEVRVVGQTYNSFSSRLGNGPGKQQNVDDGGQIGDSASRVGYRSLLPPDTVHEDAPKTKVSLNNTMALNTEMLGWDAYPDLKEPDYAYIRGDLTYAYPAARIEDYVRSFVYLNLNEEGEKRREAALIVYDNMTAGQDGLEKAWLLHTQEEPILEGNRVIMQRTENGYDPKLINDTLLPAEPTFEIIGGPGHEYEVNGHNEPAIPSKAVGEYGKWRVEVGSKYSQKRDDFLNVIQIGRKNSPVYDTELVQNDDNFVGTKIKDKVVMMAKSKNKYKRTVEVGIPVENNEGEFTYIVTGIARGRWTIKKGNEVIATYDVTEEHDTLNFKAPAGTYSLNWAYLAKDPDRDMTFEGNIVEKNRSLAKVKANNFFVDFDHPVVEMNGTTWVHVKELMALVGFEEWEYKFSEDGRSLTVNEYKMDISDDPEETNALKMIDGELYVPIYNMGRRFYCSASYYPISKALIISVSGRITDEDRARMHDWKEPGYLFPAKASQSLVSGSTNVFDALDESTATYAYFGGINEWMQVELRERTSVKRAEIYWYQGHKRSMDFEIQVSSDGENFTSVFRGKSSGTTQGFETFPLAENSNTKYIRVIGYGHSNGGPEFSVTSIKFFK